MVNRNPREASNRSRIFLYSLVYVCMCVTPTGQTKNDTGLNFGTHTPLNHIQKRVFCFCQKSDHQKTALSRGFFTYI